jgi:tetratricopeptide (TPR) repeat protein
MNNLANLLRAEGKLADAAELLVKAVQLAPTDVRYMLNLADTLMSLRRHADAAEYFERALALAPSVGAISAAVGRCYRHRKAHRIASHRTAPHRTAPHRTAPHQPFARMWALHVRPCEGSGASDAYTVRPLGSEQAAANRVGAGAIAPRMPMPADTHLSLPQGARRF